jgi:hypothetical protein
MIAFMKESPIIGEPKSHDQTLFESCESLIFCLNNRRFVVVRKDAPSSLRPVAEDATEGDWPKLERLRAGDQVFYKGKKAMIRAIDRYR